MKNRTIEELKRETDVRSAMIDCLEVMMERQRWYMKRNTDENGDEQYDIPDADSSDFTYFEGYQKCIDAVYKLLK